MSILRIKFLALEYCIVRRRQVRLGTSTPRFVVHLVAGRHTGTFEQGSGARRARQLPLEPEAVMGTDDSLPLGFFPQERSDDQTAHYCQVLEAHGLDDGVCRICHVLRCRDWVDAFDRLAAAGKLMAPAAQEGSVGYKAETDRPFPASHYRPAQRPAQRFIRQSI